MPWNLQTHSLPQEKGGYRDILVWTSMQSMRSGMGLALDCPGAVGLHSTTFPCVPCTPQGTGSPPALPFSHADSPDPPDHAPSAPENLILSLLALSLSAHEGLGSPKPSAPPHNHRRVNPSGKAAPAARGFAQLMMIRARERPHRGGVIQLKRVGLAKSTPGATSTSPPAQRGLAQRKEHTKLLAGSSLLGLAGVTLLLCHLSHYIPRFLHTPVPAMGLGHCVCCLGSCAS